MRRSDGILALQLHAGAADEGAVPQHQVPRAQAGRLDLERAEPAQQKKIVFIAGKPSHGYAEHEHRAGCLLLAKALNENVPQVHAEVVDERLAEGREHSG